MVQVYTTFEVCQTKVISWNDCKILFTLPSRTEDIVAGIEVEQCRRL